MDLFEQAARQKLRFPSAKGDLTAENLWDLPLTSKGGFDLDSVAKAINTSLKAEAEESFVAVSANPRKAQLETQLAIVKYVIAERIKESEATRQRSERAAERQRLIAILGDKQDEQLRSMTAEEIRKRINELDG